MKQIAKHIFLLSRNSGQFLIACEAIRKRTFEADAQRADERRRSAQRGGVRSIGWLDFSAATVGYSAIGYA